MQAGIELNFALGLLSRVNAVVVGDKLAVDQDCAPSSGTTKRIIAGFFDANEAIEDNSKVVTVFEACD